MDKILQPAGGGGPTSSEQPQTLEGLTVGDGCCKNSWEIVSFLIGNNREITYMNNNSDMNGYLKYNSMDAIKRDIPSGSLW